MTNLRKTYRKVWITKT